MTECMLNHLLKPQKNSWGSPLREVMVGSIMVRCFSHSFLWEMGENIGHCVSGVRFEAYREAFNDTLFAGVDWNFQQDSAMVHAAKSTQKWLEENIPNFIRKTDWTSGNPDLNPLDYEIWEKLEEMNCKKPHCNLESLKRSLEQGGPNFLIETLRKAIEQWPELCDSALRRRPFWVKWYGLDLELFPLFKYILLFLVPLFVIEIQAFN